jgi:hypothetical protein
VLVQLDRGQSGSLAEGDSCGRHALRAAAQDDDTSHHRSRSSRSFSPPRCATRLIKGIFVLIGGIIAAVLCGLIAKTKGYSALLFAVLGFFFSIITLIVVLVIPRKR